MNTKARFPAVILAPSSSGWRSRRGRHPRHRPGSGRHDELRRHDVHVQPDRALRHITLGDGNQLLAWGYAVVPGTPRRITDAVPGPTLIVNEATPSGSRSTTRCRCRSRSSSRGSRECRRRPAARGAHDRSAGGRCGRDLRVRGLASRTFIYQSGTQPELEIEMGLAGALIVRPAGFAEGDDASHPQRRAYAGAGSATTASTCSS